MLMNAQRWGSGDMPVTKRVFVSTRMGVMSVYVHYCLEGWVPCYQMAKLQMTSFGWSWNNNHERRGRFPMQPLLRVIVQINPRLFNAAMPIDIPPREPDVVPTFIVRLIHVCIINVPPMHNVDVKRPLLVLNTHAFVQRGQWEMVWSV